MENKIKKTISSLTCLAVLIFVAGIMVIAGYFYADKTEQPQPVTEIQWQPIGVSGEEELQVPEENIAVEEETAVDDISLIEGPKEIVTEEIPPIEQPSQPED